MHTFLSSEMIEEYSIFGQKFLIFPSQKIKHLIRYRCAPVEPTEFEEFLVLMMYTFVR
jgi:hypothetical protein